MEITISEISKLVKNLDTISDLSSIKSDTLFEEAGLDSLDRMNLFLDIEEQFGITIGDDDFQKLNNIDDIVNFMNKK